MTSSGYPAEAPERAGPRARPRAVLFDLDGTLVNTGPDIAAAVNRMLADLGRQVYPLERILEWVGEGAARLVERALVGGRDARPPEAELERSLALFYEHYTAGICVRSEPYPHVRKVLERLHADGIRIGCVTNKPERLTRALLEALALAPLFDVVVGGDTLGVKKPRPEPIQHACRELGLRPEETVYVGDSMTDWHTANAAGVPLVVVTYGYDRSADLTQAPCTAMIDSFEALPDALAGADNHPSKQ